MEVDDDGFEKKVRLKSLVQDIRKEIAARVDGVGKDAAVVTNAQGGKQSDSPCRADLFPPLAFLHVGKILKYGAGKYGENNWHKLSVREHLNHALVHAFAWLAGDDQDDHLGHFACRAVMALEIHLMGKQKEGGL